MVKVKQNRIKARKSSENLASKKSFNNLSIENPEKDLMDMHYGQARDPVQLYKLEISKASKRDRLRSNEMQSLASNEQVSIDHELYSNRDIEHSISTNMYLPQDQSPRVSVVQFTEPLVLAPGESIDRNSTEGQQLAEAKFKKDHKPGKSTLRPRPEYMKNTIVYDSIQSSIMSANAKPRENLKKNIQLFMQKKSDKRRP